LKEKKLTKAVRRLEKYMHSKQNKQMRKDTQNYSHIQIYPPLFQPPAYLVACDEKSNDGTSRTMNIL
jgi:hypothetical protein